MGQSNPIGSELSNSSCFSPHSIQQLQQRMQKLSVSKGSFLYHEGDASDHFYYLYSGKVRLTKQNDEGKQLTVDWYLAHDLFGQIESFDQGPHTYSAEVLEDVEVGSITVHELEMLITQNPTFGMEFMRWMGNIHRITQAKFRDLMLFGKPGALCSVLIRLVNMHGVKMGQGIWIDEKITHTELAELIGATRESVNRMLSDLKQHGILSVRDGYLVVHDLSYLKDLCHCEECPKHVCRI
jgi:CRP-like cAMP-binding protein